MSVFEFVNSINFTKQDLFADNPHAEKEYVPFIVNRALSYFPDTVFFSNEVNRFSTSPKQWQYDFLLHSIQKQKRFSKWAKRDVISEDVIAVSKFYKYSLLRAAEVLPILSLDQLSYIKQETNEGGT